VNKAKQHYAERYHLQHAVQPDNYWLYGYIAALGVRSVFEFGCNVGRHLNQLRRQGHEVDGCDINPRAVEAAHLLHGLTLRCGDETLLAEFDNGAYDLVLTVSVLSHMPKAKETIAQLRRIARSHLILVETRSRTDKLWWVHDYPGQCVHSYHAEKVNAVYQIWHERTS